MEKSITNEFQLFKFSFENAIDAIFWINIDGKIIYANKSALQSLGYSRSELLVRSVHDIDPNFQKEDWVAHWKELEKSGGATFESLHKKKNGMIFPVEIRVNHLEVDHTAFHCAFVRDITESKKAEKLLMENEERFRRTLDVTSDGMWDRDLQTGAVYYGSNYAAALGYSEEDFLSGNVTWRHLLHPDDKELAIEAVNNHLQGKTEKYSAEFRLRNSNNGWQWMLAKGKVIEKDEKERPLRFVGTHTDITKRKQVEEDLLKTSEKIKKFAYSVVHDLKNPAIVVHGLSKRLKEKFDAIPIYKKIIYCQQLLQSSGQIIELVDKINVFTATQQTPLFMEKVSLKEVVSTIREEFSAQLLVRSIDWQEFNTYPMVMADRISLLRVLRNFVDNSLKYGGDSLSKISISYQNTSGYHVISVRDNGVGIQKEETDNVFMPFERSKTSNGKLGSGLGLAIVKEIADQHKGEVWIEHSCKRGILFSFAISKNL